MYDIVAVHCFQSVDQASAEKPGLLLREFPLSSQMESQVTSKQQVHDKVQILWVLECVMGVDYEFGVDHRQKLELIHDWLYTLLVHDSRLEHFFHGKLGDFLSLEPGTADSPDLAESSSANGVLVLEQVFIKC